MLNPFHLAIPVDDLDLATRFYTTVLGCSEGRRDKLWVDLNLFGHQLVLHQFEQMSASPNTNPVDGDHVPVPHFGVVLDWDSWHTLATQLQEANVEFVIEPHIRFQGEVGEQATLFFKDPSGNALEFKSFKDMNQLFAT